MSILGKSYIIALHNSWIVLTIREMVINYDIAKWYQDFTVLAFTTVSYKFLASNARACAASSMFRL